MSTQVTQNFIGVLKPLNETGELVEVGLAAFKQVAKPSFSFRTDRFIMNKNRVWANCVVVEIADRQVRNGERFFVPLRDAGNDLQLTILADTTPTITDHWIAALVHRSGMKLPS